MKSGSIFWGVLLITLGAFFLLYNFSMGFDIGFILDLWPLVLVVWGVSLLKISPLFKNILSGISGALLGMIIVALISSGMRCSTEKFDWNNDFFNDSSSLIGMDTDSVTVSFDSTIAHANLTFSGGAGEFKMKGGGRNLLDFYTKGELAAMQSNFDENHTNADINISISSDHVKLNEIDSRAGDILLHTQPVWTISLKVGAAEFAGDLSELKIEKLYMSAGAADISFKLGALLDSSFYQIETGVANVEISIPESAGCQIRTLAGLSAKDFQGFVKDANRVWTTPNFDTAQKKIYLVLKGGMSNFEVSKY